MASNGDTKTITSLSSTTRTGRESSGRVVQEDDESYLIAKGTEVTFLLKNDMQEVHSMVVIIAEYPENHVKVYRDLITKEMRITANYKTVKTTKSVLVVKCILKALGVNRPFMF